MQVASDGAPIPVERAESLRATVIPVVDNVHLGDSDNTEVKNTHATGTQKLK